jgi:hypothetical protein
LSAGLTTNGIEMARKEIKFRSKRQSLVLTFKVDLIPAIVEKNYYWNRQEEGEYEKYQNRQFDYAIQTAVLEYWRNFKYTEQEEFPERRSAILEDFSYKVGKRKLSWHIRMPNSDEFVTEKWEATVTLKYSLPVFCWVVLTDWTTVGQETARNLSKVFCNEESAKAYTESANTDIWSYGGRRGFYYEQRALTELGEAPSDIEISKHLTKDQ